MGLKKAIEKSAVLREKTITLPISGESIRLVVISRREHRAFVQYLKTGDVSVKDDYSDELLVARCAVDALGNRELTDEDVLAGAFDRLDMADWTLLRTTALDLLVAKWVAVDDALKNSKPTATSDSSGG